MQNLFERKRPNAEAILRVKTLISEHHGLSDTTTLTVAELRCHEPGCPPIETVFTARDIDGSVSDWRIAKPVKDITIHDIKILNKNTKTLHTNLHKTK
jgi:hypothetical protein